MKQRIDHTNYEAWLLDRIEGTLGAEQERALDAFLAANPGLDPGVEEMPTLRADGTRLSGFIKNSLKHELPPKGLPNGATVEDFLIARLENDLTAEQRSALEVYLFEHPELARSERLLALTRTIPEPVAYGDTQKLERRLPPAGMPTRDLLEDFLVARMEGDLDSAQEQALSALLTSDAVLQRAWDVMQRTRVEAKVIAYPHKGELKKGGRVIAFAPWAVRLAAAASVALLIGAGIWYAMRPVTHDPGTAIAKRTDNAIEAKETPREVAVAVEVGVDPKKDPMRAVKGQQVDQRTPMAVKSVKPEQKEQRAAPDVLPIPAPLASGNDGPLAQHAPVPDVEPVITPSPKEPAPSVTPERKQPALPAAVMPNRASQEVTTVGGALAATLRVRVLDEPKGDTRPLDRADAFAMVDKGLRAVSGETAGLAVDRGDDGKVGGFKLRLGRNLAISASR